MTENPKFVTLPSPGAVDGHFLVEGIVDVHPFTLGVIQNHDQDIRHFAPDVITFGFSEFRDFTIELDKHR